MDAPLIIGAETVAMLDRFEVDWRAFLAARISSHFTIHHTLPSTLTIIDRGGQIVPFTRRMEIEYLYMELAEET